MSKTGTRNVALFNVLERYIYDMLTVQKHCLVIKVTYIMGTLNF